VLSTNRLRNPEANPLLVALYCMNSWHKPAAGEPITVEPANQKNNSKGAGACHLVTWARNRKEHKT